MVATSSLRHLPCTASVHGIQHTPVENSMNRISHNIKFRTCQYDTRRGKRRKSPEALSIGVRLASAAESPGHGA
jgi:hypothetical protein